MFQIENYKEANRLYFCYFILPKSSRVFQLERFGGKGKILFYKVHKDVLFNYYETVI